MRVSVDGVDDVSAIGGRFELRARYMYTINFIVSVMTRRIRIQFRSSPPPSTSSVFTNHDSNVLDRCCPCHTHFVSVAIISFKRIPKSTSCASHSTTTDILVNSNSSSCCCYCCAAQITCAICSTSIKAAIDISLLFGVAVYLFSI